LQSEGFLVKLVEIIKLTTDMVDLQHEIDRQSSEMHTESLSMSIGEVISMYRDGDLNIHPEFQRFYRWTDYQKSKLVESILLNIPIPPIYVAQRGSGIWDVVDGLQRLSTILQFAGILKDEEKQTKAALKLKKTDLLPSLENKFWDSANGNSFTDAQQRYFKRSRLHFIIIKKESDPSGKYELFQRLNTGGSSLESQEVRNCLLIMHNEAYFQKLNTLSEFPPFLECINLSDKNLIEQYDKELASRFLVLKDKDASELSRINDLGGYLDEKIIQFFNENLTNWTDTETQFKSTFQLINDNVGSDAFKRYSIEKDIFYGGFIVSAFEMVALGVVKNLSRYETKPQLIKERIKECWRKINAEDISWKGYSASGRLPKTISIGQQIFNEG